MNQDSAVGRALKTLLQSVIGTLVAVWAVPGVQDVVAQNVVDILLVVGVPSAIVAFIYNAFRRDVPNV